MEQLNKLIKTLFFRTKKIKKNEIIFILSYHNNKRKLSPKNDSLMLILIMFQKNFFKKYRAQH